MEKAVLTRKHMRGKHPVKNRKPSKPLDGINHRLLREQAVVAIEPEPVPEPVLDDAAPTRAELEAKATELGIRFDGRTPDRKLGQLIQHRITGV
jgi:hypothetical protein